MTPPYHPAARRWAEQKHPKPAKPPTPATPCPTCGADIQLVQGRAYQTGTPLLLRHECEPTVTTEIDDFLGTGDFVRNGRQQPLIIPPGGDKPVPYQRVSTFCGTLSDPHGLLTWKARNTALGVARHEELAAMIAALNITGNKLKDRAVNKELDGHIETAICRVTDAAAYGTAIHAFTEPDPSPYVPERMQADVASYRAALEQHHLEVVESEVYVVHDQLKVAGKFDNIYEHPALGRLMGDTKSGSIKAQEVAIQLACYGGSMRYDVDTGERTPLDVRQDIGLLVHIPRGEGKTEIHIVDLEAGRAAAKAAAWVMAWRKRDDLLTHLNELTILSLAS